MLDAIRRLFANFADEDRRTTTSNEELELAAAALLFHVIAIDGVISEQERATLELVLERRFGLEREQLAALMRDAETAEAEAIDLFAFTSVLKRRLDLRERERLVAMMWELVYADGSLHELEDNVVWRISELLDVPARTRVLLKKEAGDHDS